MSILPALQVPLLEEVLADHRAGRLDAAEAGYRAILTSEPDHPDALHLLGVAAHQSGRAEEAVTLIRRAIDLHPVEGVFFCNLGDALRATGRVDEAEAALRQALALNPRLAEAHNNLGLALRARREEDGARGAFLRALTLNPYLIDAEINLAISLAAGGNAVEASERLERVLRLDPDSIEAHYHLASLLADQDLPDPAIQHFRAALARQPTHRDAWNDLGLVLGRCGRHDEAVAAFEAALRLDPDDPGVLTNLGLASMGAGDGAAARLAFECALVLAPGFAPPHNGLGMLLRGEGRVEAALDAFRTAVGLDPTSAAHGNLVDTLTEEGRLDDAVEAWRAAVRQDAATAGLSARVLRRIREDCRFDLLTEVEARVEAETAAALDAGECPGETPIDGYRRRADPALHHGLASAWAAETGRLASRLGLGFDHEPRRGPRTRLRVGWLAPDLGTCPLARQALRLIAAHDPRAVEIVVYTDGGRHGRHAETETGGQAARFVDLRDMDARGAARRIYADEVDVLLDLGGEARTDLHPLSALRPAPVQVGWLGWPGNTAGRFADYLLADPIIVPAVEFGHYDERIVHLPAPCLPVGDHLRVAGGGPGRVDVGLPENAFVLACFAGPWAIDPVLFDLWMALLREIPESVLWLRRGSAGMAPNLRLEAEARGVAGGRLVVAGADGHGGASGCLSLADLALDTRICTDAPATGEALGAGVPVVGLIGAAASSRATASMLSGLGLGDLLASDLEHYRAKVRELAASPGELAKVRGRLGRALGSSRQADPGWRARTLEAALRQMWDRFERGLPPKSFAVPAVRIADRSGTSPTVVPLFRGPGCPAP